MFDARSWRLPGTRSSRTVKALLCLLLSPLMAVPGSQDLFQLQAQENSVAPIEKAPEVLPTGKTVAPAALLPPTDKKTLDLLAEQVKQERAGPVQQQAVQPVPVEKPTLEKVLSELVELPDAVAVPELEPGPQIRILPQWNDAVALAVADLQNLKAAAAQRGLAFRSESFRYVWVPDKNPDDLALVSFVANSVISRSDVTYPPHRPGSPIQFVGGGQLVRIDLLALCPRDKGKDFEEVAAVWNEMFNPYALMEESAEQKVVIEFENVKVQVPWYTHTDGKRYEYAWERKQVERIVQKAGQRVFGPHINPELGATLQALTASENPIVWCYSLYKNALTQADGGSYYKFLGVKKATAEQKAQGLSDFDVFLLSNGTSKKEINALRADQRVAMTISGIAGGKPRRIDFFDRSSRTSNNQGLITITQDMFDGDYDAKADPLLNLLEFKVGGSEVIYERNNGPLGYLLFDGDGNLVNEAPPNLVADFHVPDPYTKRLQPAIGCIRCHSKNGSEGWQPVTNHVRMVMSTMLNAYDDEAGVKQNIDVPDTLAKLVRLYDGVMDKPLRRAREDHSDTIVVTTDNVVNDKGLPWKFADVGAALEQRFLYFSYTAITPRFACSELGYHVEDEAQAVLLLNRLLGTLPRAAELPVHREDIRLGLLKVNIPINRFQWELVFVDAAVRSQNNTAAAMPAAQKPGQ